MTKTEPITLTEAAGIVILTALSREDAADILEEMDHKDLQQLSKRLIELVSVARSYRGNSPSEPPLTDVQWCDAVIRRHAHLTTPTPKPAPPKEKRS